MQNPQMTLSQKAWTFILALTIFRLLYVIFLPITPQEAYYWNYAQHPALSYFDHPPMTAWSIWLGTHIFGHTFFGVKVIAVLWGLLTNIMLYLTMINAVHAFWPHEKSRAAELGFFVLILYNLTVFSHFYSLLAVPDSPLLFFWILSVYLFLKLLVTGEKKYWLFVGLSLGLGLVSKYTMIMLLPGLFVILLFKKEWRRWLFTIYPYLALLIMALVFAPVVYWNYRHEWASFAFQFSDRAGGLKRVQTKYIGQLLVSQFFMLTPLLFFPLAKTLFVGLKRWRTDAGLLYFTLSGFFIIAAFSAISLRSLVKMNWLLPGYMGLFAAIGYLYYDKFKRRGLWMRLGVGFSLFLILVAYLLQIIPNMPIDEGNTWSGWPDAAQQIYKLQDQHGGRQDCFIFANSYKSASLLKFYLPEHQQTYAQNIYGRPALQFDIWGAPDSLLGKNALYVFTDRHEYKDDLHYVKKYFDSVSPLQEFEYRFAGAYHTRTIYCYFAENYHGLSTDALAVVPPVRP